MNSPEFIRDRSEVTNLDILMFTFDMGHPNVHARKCLTRLKREDKVVYEGQIGISYESCIRNGKIKTVKAVLNG